MTEAKHTPGPYRVDGKGWIVTEGNPYGHGHMHVADCRGWGHLTGKGACAITDNEAFDIQCENARLIAAAPELLRVLEIVASGELPHPNTSDRDGLMVNLGYLAGIARDAIEKATKP